MSKNKKLRPEKLSSTNQIKAPIGSTNDQKPIFSFHHHGKAYCIQDCLQDEQAAFAEKLYQLSQFTWDEIIKMPREANGYELMPKASLPKAPTSITDEFDKFLVFRFFGRGRIAGYRNREIFHVIWIDCNFTLYNHGS